MADGSEVYAFEGKAKSSSDKDSGSNQEEIRKLTRSSDIPIWSSEVIEIL